MMDEVTRLGRLARIRLRAEEKSVIAPQVERIIGYFQKLKELKLSGVEPTTHGVVPGIGSQGRADEPIPPGEEIWAGLPYLKHRHFSAPRALIGP